jgi:nitrate/TMAO reductase-like tetraheme cytochrome c subunit
MKEWDEEISKTILICFGVVVGVVIFVVGIYFLNLSIKENFGTYSKNIDRKIFEETKSYVHGKIQDLANYYQEYQLSSQDEKEIIANVIKVQFADFEADKIKEDVLRAFLIEIRRY